MKRKPLSQEKLKEIADRRYEKMKKMKKMRQEQGRRALSDISNTKKPQTIPAPHYLDASYYTSKPMVQAHKAYCRATNQPHTKPKFWY